tara:strand:- start:1399 stop:2661 length:1263 start_codon:yes stop_codon:yes gene_type:complete
MKLQSNQQLVFGVIIGNIVEWYSFSLFAHFAIINDQFFPQFSHSTQRILVTFVFAAGFVLRPIGGVLFGYLGDKFGRLHIFTASILVLLIPNLLIGVLPTYAQIGGIASVLLIVLRLMQGLSAGGELPGSIVFAVEHCDAKRRGLFTSIPIMGALLGMLLTTIVSQIMSLVFTPDEIAAGAWRIPFFLTTVLAIGGYFLRRGMLDTPKFLDLKHSGRLTKTPIRDTLQHWPLLIRTILVGGISGTCVYLFFIYITTFLNQTVHIGVDDANKISFFGLLAFAVLTPFIGWLSDKIGRKPIILCGIIGLVIDAYPIYILMNLGDFEHMLVAEALLGILGACVLAPLPALLAENYPTRIRYTAIALSYNISFALFGGFAPTVSVLLQEHFHSARAPSLFVIVTGIIALLAMKKVKELYRHPLQ